MSTPPPPSARPRRGDELELTVDSLAYGGNGVARREDGYVVFVAGARARRPRPRRRRQGQAAYAEARAVEIARAVARPHRPRSPTTRARRGRCSPTSASSRSRPEQVDDALTRIGRLEGFELEPIVPARRAVALPQQARVLVRHRRRTASSCAASTRPAAGTRSSRSTTACSPPSAATQLREQVLAELPPPGPGRLGPPRRSSGFLRNLVVREGRRTGELQVRLVTSPGKLDVDALIDAVDCDGLFWTQTAGLGESTQGGETHAALRHAAAARAARRPRLPDLARGVLPDQHRDGRGALRRTPPRSPALRGHERVFDLYCGIGTIGLSLAARAREVVGVEIVEPAVADAIENARLNEITNASLLRRRHPARDARAGRARRPARRRGHRPAARRPLAEGRAPDHRGRAEADRLRLLQPDDARAERGAARRGRLRRSSACGPVDMFPQTPHIECVALLEAAR